MVYGVGALTIRIGLLGLLYYRYMRGHEGMLSKRYRR